MQTKNRIHSEYLRFRSVLHCGVSRLQRLRFCQNKHRAAIPLVQITLVSSGERLVAEKKSKVGTKSLAHLQKKGVKVRRHGCAVFSSPSPQSSRLGLEAS